MRKKSFTLFSAAIVIAFLTAGPAMAQTDKAGEWDRGMRKCPPGSQETDDRQGGPRGYYGEEMQDRDMEQNREPQRRYHGPSKQEVQPRGYYRGDTQNGYEEDDRHRNPQLGPGSPGYPAGPGQETE